MQTPTIIKGWFGLPTADGGPEELYDSDPGSRPWAIGALIAVAVFVPLVILFQQFALGMGQRTLVHVPKEVREDERARDPGCSQIAVVSKMLVKMDAWVRAQGAELEPEPGDGPPMASIDESALTRTDRLRAAMVAGELEGPAAALSRLGTLAPELTPGGNLAGDAEWLKLLYQKGANSLPDDVRKSLAKRHGWFGRLAVSRGMDEGAGFRKSVVGGGGKIISFILTTIGILGFVVLGGIVAAIICIVKLSQGSFSPQFSPANPGGSVYLETYAAFLVCFFLYLSLHLLFFGAGVEGTGGAMIVLEFILWAAAAAALWPIARGVPYRRALADLGWHTGEGVAKEIGCGVFGFLAMLPLVVIGRILGAIVEGLFTSDAAATETPGGYPMFDPPSVDSWALYVMTLLGTLVWAPVLEETFYRGALYRHIRSRSGFLPAAILSAAMFGFIHPYSASGLIQVSVAGIGFAAMREWRGCLIGCVVAHFLHNFTVSLMEYGIVIAVG